MGDPVVMNIVVKLISKRRDIELEYVQPDTRLIEDLGLDSLDIVEFIADLEETLRTPVDFASIEDLRTPASIAEALLHETGREAHFIAQLDGLNAA